MRKAKRSGYRLTFAGGMVIYLFIMLIAIAVGTVYFWRYIEAYELSRIDHILRSLEENIDYNYWESSMEKVLAPRLTEFERDGIVPMELYRPRIRNVRYSLRQKTDENTVERPVYIIRAGAKDIGIIRLIPKTEAGFGFYLWDVESVEFIESFADNLERSISITASVNAYVELNGVPVTKAHSVECEYEYGASYVVHGIFGDADVTVVEFDGRRTEPYYAENGEFLFPITRPFTRSHNIIVSDSMTVLIDGVPAPEEYITQRWVPDIISDIVTVEDSPALIYKYEFTFEEVYIAPVVIVVDAEGNELVPGVSDDGADLYEEEYSLEYKERFGELAESFIHAYVSFASNVGGNVSANFTDVNSYLLRGTDLHRRIGRTRTNMTWVGGRSVEYIALDVEKFRPYGDNLFSCEAYYDLINVTNYEAREIEARYELLFVRSGNRWLVSKMVAIDLEELHFNE